MDPRRLLLPILLLALGVGGLSSRHLFGESPWLAELGLSDLGTPVFWTLIWIGVTWLATRCADALLVRRYKRRSGRDAPRLLRDLVRALIWLAGACALSISVFEVPPGAAFTTSGVLVAIVGFAIRNMIADLFYGVTLALERPFEIGDWIEMPTGGIGQVTEFTWRAVKLVSRDNLKIIVPNSTLATTPLVNYDQPNPTWRSSLRVTLDHDVDTKRAERLLVSAVEQVTESASLSHAPEARIVELRPEGAVWELRFWVPDYTALSRVSQRIYEAVLHNLHLSGVRIPRSKEDVLVGPLADEREAEDRAVGSWIDRIELFDALESEERADLGARARPRAFPKGTTVIKRGAPGSSLFVLAEGALVVSADAEGEGPPIATMRPGDFFGEMSLLTGEPRSASVRASVDTVVYEITRSDLMPILERHPALPRELAAALEAYQHADAARAHVESDVQRDGEDRETRVSRLRNQIRTWFKLPDE